MAQTTPGGRPRKRTEPGYVPFNPKPKDVGTRTGQNMPQDVPRTKDGFEDPDEFFKSPAGAGDTTSRSIGSALRRTPGTAMSTPATVSKPKQGRMAALGGDDSGDEYEAGLLLDDDDDLGGIGTPAPFFAGDAPPGVAMPKNSRLPPASPNVEFDHLPSPGSTKRRKTVNGLNLNRVPDGSHSARKSTNVIHSPLPLALDSDFGGADELDDAMVSHVIPIPFSVNKKKRKSSAPNGGQGSDDEEGVEMGRNAEMNRLSMLSRRSGNAVDPDADTEDEMASEAGGGPSFRFDGDASVDVLDGDDEAPLGDNGGPADDDDDVGMEQAAMDEEDEDENEDGVDAAGEPKRRPKVTAKPAKKKVISIRDRSQSAKPTQITKRSRISQLEQCDKDGFHGNFVCRRSGRQHIAPLDYWRGEKVEYKRGHLLPVIASVVRFTGDPIVPFALKSKRGGYGRSASASVKPDRHGSHIPQAAEEVGWDDNTDPIGVVREFPSGKEIQRRIAFPSYKLEPREIPGSNFKYQKVFGEDQFIAAGVVHIPVGGTKPGKYSKDNAYVFFVSCGAVQVRVHRTSFVMAPNAMFMVPRGNHYSIENISPSAEVKLFFAQARKIRVSEAEEDAAAAMAAPNPPTPSAPTVNGAPRRGSRRQSSLPSVAEEDGEESEEETPKTKGRGKTNKKS